MSSTFLVNCFHSRPVDALVACTANRNSFLFTPPMVAAAEPKVYKSAYFFRRRRDPVRPASGGLTEVFNRGYFHEVGATALDVTAADRRRRGRHHGTKGVLMSRASICHVG